MAGGKKNRKTATTATTKATAAAPAGSNTEQDPCMAVVELIKQLLPCKGTAWLTGPLTQDLLCQLSEVVEIVDEEDLMCRHIAGLLKAKLVVISAFSVKLISKLLAARKRPRDWKQQEYSSTVARVMSDVSFIQSAYARQRVPGKEKHDLVEVGDLPSAIASNSLPDLRRQAAAAQAEVCQLLQSDLKQQQQQGQQAVQQHPHLWQVGHELLSWWQRLDSASVANEEVDDSDGILAGEQPVLELAATLTQGMTADSSRQQLERIVKSTIDTASAINQTVWDRNDEDPEGKLPPVTLGLQPSILHLSLALLLAQTSNRVMWAQADSGSSNSSSSSSDGTVKDGSSDSSSGGAGAVADGSSSSATACVVTDGSGSSSAIAGAITDGSSSSSASAGTVAAGSSSSSTSSQLPSDLEQTGRLQQACRNQRQLQELALIAKQLWVQLGLSPDALPTYATAVCCFPPAHDKSKLLATTVQCIINTLTDIAGFSDQAPSDDAETAVAVPYDELSRQMQQLLPRVALQLPQLLLLLAAQTHAGSPDAPALVALAVNAAEVSISIWGMPGLLTAGVSSTAAESSSSTGALAAVPRTPPEPAAAAAAAAALDRSPGTSPSLPAPGVLSALLDAWLGLMHNLLLQPSGGLLHAAASAKVQVLPDRRIICPKILRLYVLPDDVRGRSWTCFEAPCSKVEAVSRLLVALRDLAATPAPGMPSNTLMSSPVWYKAAPGVLLLLETLTRGVLPHHVLCSAHDVDSACVIGPSLSSERGGSSSNSSPSSSSSCSERVSDAGQLLRNMLAGFVGDRSNSMLVQLCFGILQDGIRASAQQQQPPEQQPQQQLQQQPQQQPQPQGQLLLQQRLLHLWSLAVSLLKLPIRPVSSIQLVQGCITTMSTALQALQMIMRRAPPTSSTMEQQRLVFAPWLALTGRCLCAQARLLSELQALPLPADLGPLLACFHALYDCVLRLLGVLKLWRSGFYSGIARSCLWADTILDFAAHVSAASVRQLRKQFDADSAFAAGGGCAAVAAASAAAVAAAGYCPAYGDLEGLCGDLEGQLVSHLYDVMKVLTQTNKHATHLQGSSVDSSSSSGRSESDVSSSKGGSKVGKEHICFQHSSETVQLLELLGLQLCNQLPMPWLCNNPRCANLSGVSELQLVGGKACVCGGCRLARYCSHDCQSYHWQYHKLVCEQLAAAAGGSNSTLAGGQAAC